MSSHKCGGFCCEKFYLPYNPEQIRASYRRWVNRDEAPMRMGLEAQNRERVNIVQDIWIIYPMLTHLGAFDSAPFSQINPTSSAGPHNFYSCKHFDTKTRLCTIYEDRPAMCRDYPQYDHDGKCNYSDCRSKDCKDTKRKPKAERAVADNEISKVRVGKRLGRGMDKLFSKRSATATALGHE